MSTLYKNLNLEHKTEDENVEPFSGRVWLDLRPIGADQGIWKRYRTAKDVLSAVYIGSFLLKLRQHVGGSWVLTPPPPLEGS